MHGYSAVWTGPEVENKWLRKSRKKIVVRLEAQRMNASNIDPETNGKETLRPLTQEQRRPLAEIVDWARNENHMFENDRK